MASWCLLSHVVPSAGTEHAVAPLVAQVRFVVCVMRMSFAILGGYWVAVPRGLHPLALKGAHVQIYAWGANHVAPLSLPARATGCVGSPIHLYFVVPALAEIHLLQACSCLAIYYI
jgi:hypothetical protein